MKDYNSQVSLCVEKVTHNGFGLAHLAGKVFLVKGALPQEEIAAKITAIHKDYCIADIISIDSANPDRVAPPCPYYASCGGCTLLHASYPRQCEIKLSLFKEAFARAKIPLPSVEFFATPQGGYRNRVALTDGNFFARNSKSPVKIRSCYCAAPQINEWLAENPSEKRTPGRTIIFANENATPKIAIGEQEIAISIIEKIVQFKASVFFQSNIAGLKTLANLLGGLRGERFLDLFSGVGTFSAILYDCFQSITLVESNPECAKYAYENVKNARFYAQKAEEWAANSHEKYDIVLLDPPRNGCAKGVLDYFIREKPPLIAYVSCNYLTQIRDISVLIQHGYRVKSAQICDFYPNTTEMETLVLLVQ